MADVGPGKSRRALIKMLDAQQSRLFSGVARTQA
jgi:hypothetical protein